MRSSRTTRSSSSPSTRLIPRRCAPCSAASAPRRSSGPIPEVTVYAPSNHPVMDVIRTSSGRIIDQEAYDGTVSMYHIPDLGRFLKAHPAGAGSPGRSSRGRRLPLELGICADDERWLIHVDGKNSRVEPEKLSRRHLTLSPSALVRLLMGHTGDRCGCPRRKASSPRPAPPSTRPASSSRQEPIWRSPLDSATA